MALTKPAGTWTYDDLLALPDDGKRYEIIEGELFEMPAPAWNHATTVMNLIALLLSVVQSLGGRMVTAPVDVFFPGADPVEPDIVVLLPGSRAIGQGRGVEGTPDLLIEVLSPSNRGHDLLTKRSLYARAGVREYWIVDPVGRKVDVLILERGSYPEPAHGTDLGQVVSPLLGDVAFSQSHVFAGLDEIAR